MPVTSFTLVLTHTLSHRPRRQRDSRSWSAFWMNTIRSSVNWSVLRVTAAASTTWVWLPLPRPAPRPTTSISSLSLWRRPPPPAPPPPHPSAPSLAQRNTRGAGRWSARTVTEGARASPSWPRSLFFPLSFFPPFSGRGSSNGRR